MASRTRQQARSRRASALDGDRSTRALSSFSTCHKLSTSIFKVTTPYSESGNRAQYTDERFVAKIGSLGHFTYGDARGLVQWAKHKTEQFGALNETSQLPLHGTNKHASQMHWSMIQTAYYLTMISLNMLEPQMPCKQIADYFPRR